MNEAQKVTPPQQRTRPTRTFAEYFWLIKNRHDFYPDVCIDVGAAAGTPSIYLAFPKALHVAIEPLSQHIPALSKSLSGTDHIIYNVAAMDKPGNSVVVLPKNTLTMSMLSAPNASTAANKTTVTISTVDLLMEQYMNRGAFLLKTDCQGGDLFALQGAPETLKHCEVVVVEASLFRFWGDHQPDLYDIIHFMKQQGFVVHDFLDGMFRPFDRALGQIDVAFVKEEGLFRKIRRKW